MRCQNTGNRPPILAPGCYGSEADTVLLIRYNGVEDDKLRLCQDCAERIARDARMHGYEVHINPA